MLNEDAPGWVKLTKLDALDDHPIAGVQFDIYSVNADGTTGDLVTSIITDKDGMAWNGCDCHISTSFPSKERRCFLFCEAPSFLLFLIDNILLAPCPP